MEKEIKQCLTDIRDFCSDLKSKLVAATEDTGWKTLNSQIKYRRKNGVVYVVGESAGSKPLSAKQYTTVGTLPVGFRSSIQIEGLGVDAYGGAGNDFTSFITTSGEIKIYANNGTAHWKFTTSFPAGGGS